MNLLLLYFFPTQFSCQCWRRLKHYNYRPYDEYSGSLSLQTMNNSKVIFWGSYDLKKIIHCVLKKRLEHKYYIYEQTIKMKFVLLPGFHQVFHEINCNLSSNVDQNGAGKVSLFSCQNVMELALNHFWSCSSSLNSIYSFGTRFVRQEYNCSCIFWNSTSLFPKVFRFVQCNHSMISSAHCKYK